MELTHLRGEMARFLRKIHIRISYLFLEIIAHKTPKIKCDGKKANQCIDASSSVLLFATKFRFKSAVLKNLLKKEL